MVYEVVCTKSYLDIGLLVEKNPKRVLGRASTFGGKTEYGVGEYGGVELVKWVNTGVYLTIDKWIRISYNKSTDEILDMLGIKKGFKMKMQEINNCPFCGGEAKWNEKKMAPYCTECFATIPAAKKFCSPKDVVKSGYKAYMIGLWNRRYK